VSLLAVLVGQESVANSDLAAMVATVVVVAAACPQLLPVEVEVLANSASPSLSP
jgi:hypothetical protein